MNQMEVAFKHSCHCSQHGRVVIRKLPIIDGAVEMPRPVCAETRFELELISFVFDGRRPPSPLPREPSINRSH